MALDVAPPPQQVLPAPESPIEDDRFTFAEFCALIPDGVKADLIDGGIYVASPDRPHHYKVASFVQTLLDGYASEHGLGEVYASRVAFQLTEHNAPEPDVAFLKVENLDREEERCIRGGPDIAVEVVSRDSRHRDYVDKKQLYREAGVREYWIIDPRQRRAEFHRLQNGDYELVPLERNRIFRSKVLPGFWLDVEWLFLRPLPSKFRCLQQILAGEPPE